MILSRKSVFLILFSVLLTSTVSMAVYAYVPRYLSFLGAQITVISLITTILPLTAFIFPPLIGRYSDRIQKRNPFIYFGTIGVILTSILFIFSQDVLLTALLLFIYGFFISSLSIINTLYAELVENDQKYISYYTAFTSLGWFLGAIIFGIIIDIYGLKSIFILMLIFSVANCFVIIFIKENRSLILKRHEEKKVSEKIDPVINGINEISPVSPSIYYGLFFRNFGLRPIIAILAVLMALHLKGDTEIGLLIGINPLIQFFLVILIGRIITDKNLKSFMIVGFLLNSIVVVGYIISMDFFGFLFYQILVSLAFSLFWTSTQVYIAKNTTPKNKGKYMGFANSSFYFGSFMGGLFFSFLLSIYGDYYMAMWYMIIFPIISGIIILCFFNVKKGVNLSSKRDRGPV